MQKIKSQKLSSHEVEEMNSEINVILVSVNFSFSGPPISPNPNVFISLSDFPRRSWLERWPPPSRSWNF